MAKDKKNDLKNLSYDEMVAKLNELKKQYMDLRFQSVLGHVENPMQKRAIRRDIARLNTFIHQQDLEKFRAAAAESIAAKN
ncbi:MAG: 50S ribosomal protein L29 [Treponema sp.]|nr:50S ribosomal protein L29 [Candidatus Treponema equi]